MKKLWVSALAVVMVLACVFGFNMAQNNVMAAEYNDDMLNVKFQVATNDSNVIRFVASVDNLDYQNVGFEVMAEGWEKAKSYSTTTVYERIASTTDGVAYEFSPKVVDLSSSYFVTAKLNATEGVDYRVKAFVTMKGTGEKVYGAERIVSLSDADADKINTAVAFAATKGSNYDVYDGDTKIGTAVALSDTYVRITLSDTTVNDFPSATELTFKSGSSSVGTMVYRNYYTTYAKDGADTTWYDVDPDATTLVIASSADLWGLANVVNTKQDVLTGQTVILIRDVAATDGTLNVANEGNAASDYTFTGTTLDWVGIGSNAKRFDGTFDGDGNTISGLYTKTESGSGVGLFGYTNSNCVIKNVSVENSYIAGTYMVGGVVGLLKGNVENLHVADDVVIKLTGSSGAGGIAGQFDNTATKKVSTCWFDGVIASAKPRVGGIVGRIYNGTNFTIENCLDTGRIISADTSATPRVGGIAGSVADNNSIGLKIKNCVSTAEISSNVNTTVGSVVGQLTGAKNTATLTDVYVVESATFDTTNGGDGFGSSSLDSATVTGKPVIFDSIAKLQGEAGYVNTDLDFENVWVATANGPELQMFSEATPVDLTKVTTVRSNDGWYCNAFSNATKGSLALPAKPVFEINSESDFYDFAVMAGTDANYRFTGATVNLVTDIDMNPGWDATTKEAATVAWPGIGTTASLNFNGTFNGNGNTIRGIYTNDSALSGGYEALFGYTGNNSTVENFRLENSYFYSTGGNLGSIAGVTKGSIKDIYVADTVYVEGTSTPVGGIAGIHSGSTSYPTTISNCQFDGTVKGTNSRSGGFIGRFYTGKLTIENCLFTGTATTATTTTNAKVAGFIAEIGAENTSHSVTIKNCLSNGTVESGGTSNVGAVIGAFSNANVTLTHVYAVDNRDYIGSKANTTITCGKLGYGSVPTNANIVTGIPAIVTLNELTGNNAYIYTGLDLDGGVWQVSENGTPELASFTDATAMTSFTGTPIDTKWYNDNWRSVTANTYIIDTAADMASMERVVDTYKENFKGHTVKLGADIKMNGDWVPVIDANGNLTNAPSNAVKLNPIGDSTTFMGTSDGQGHSISGVYMTRNDVEYAALFARIDKGGVIKNLAVKDSYIKQTGNRNWAAGILGFSYGGEVANLYSNAIVVSDGLQMGGVIARAEGTVDNCWFDGTLICARTSWVVKAGIGGVVGTTVRGSAAYDLTISNCLNTGKIVWKVDTEEILGIGGIFGATRSATPNITVQNCISVGTYETTGTNGIGTMVGLVNESATKYTIQNCYATTECGVEEFLGADTASVDGSAVTGCVIVDEDAITGAALYANEEVSLDYNIWVARSNDVPAIKYFVGTIVPEADTVAKPAE